MWRNRIALCFVIALFCPLMLSAVGCRTTVGGGSLPSPNDGIQYFPAPLEFKLTNLVQPLEEYKLEREKLRAGLDDVPQHQHCVDDVQYIPPGPDFQVTNQKQALHEYKIEREKLRARAIRDVPVHSEAEEDVR
ncbi:MAG: hypothetical protein IAG10_20260 [Planctomycetaceae bacterium]|nr:hypothetical protein [Planctomycetaceae bacterium]